jgi:hypothetical protein
MATITSWSRDILTYNRFTIVRYSEVNLTMRIKDATTKTVYEVTFDSIDEFAQFINADDNKRAKLVKYFKG